MNCTYDPSENTDEKDCSPLVCAQTIYLHSSFLNNHTSKLTQYNFDLVRFD